ncbi:replication factor C subunit 1 isoform X2 [Cucurbita pepo subsp. pepo]|uniref:replication factor C subunit 1 isoform X2 n=1 Tax=Cucurbita pepo subsp. pepo TaxID=3664 RepID=UPI000C9D3319|nr:replication factor C subunit 1 isoform X2 [Cucurbita pepo subsp. pepo]
MADIRKWFMKAHDKDNGSASKHAKPDSSSNEKSAAAELQSGKAELSGGESTGRRITSKYFASEKQKSKDTTETEELPIKRKSPQDAKESPAKRRSQKDSKESLKVPPLQKLNKIDDNDDDAVISSSRKNLSDVTPNKKLKSGSGKGITQKPVKIEESDDEEAEGTESSRKQPSGRGRGGRGSSAATVGGRGRGGGRGGFMNFGERKDPPHKGEKEVPEGAPDCLAGLTFVISGTLDSLEREEAEDLIKRHGGRITGSISKKTNYLLCDEDIGGRKSSKAKELGTAFLTEDGLFDIIRASGTKAPPRQDSKKSVVKSVESPTGKSSLKVQAKTCKDLSAGAGASPAKQKRRTVEFSSLTWTEKYKPKVPNDIIGNQSLVKQLHDWLAHWNENFLDGGSKKKGKKLNDSGAKKAILLCGGPGIGKTTSAKLVSRMLGYEAIEVNASDNRGKSDAKIQKGISGSNANTIKELISNSSLHFRTNQPKHPKTVLIMDEVDGMSAGDRGGVADLIASIKSSKIPIICICNDRYSQKLKSLVNYCLILSFRKPTKQQMAKRLSQVANAEGLQVNEIALEELAERVNGDIRMALNQLQYLSLSMSVIKYDDIRQRLLGSMKDEDISPFTAVDKLFGFNSGKLRMDERIDLSMSDMDLVPLLIQENYINYRPSSVSKDDNGIKRMDLMARAAESIADGDIINVQIRRHRQWQLSQSSSIASCVIPASLLHGQRETLEQGERNFNRFSAWLGKNSTFGKNMRLLEDLHVHILASRESCSRREHLRVENLTLFLKRLTEPLHTLPKDEAVKMVVDFMSLYSISQEDFDTVMELSKFQGRKNPLDGVAPAVKAALTKAYKEARKTQMVRTADLITLPGIKKAPKKRIAAMLEPAEDTVEGNGGDALAESDDENSLDNDDTDSTNAEKKLQLELQNLKKEGMEVQLDLKGVENSNAKKPGGRGRGGGSQASEKKGGGRGSGSATKRKR